MAALGEGESEGVRTSEGRGKSESEEHPERRISKKERGERDIEKSGQTEDNLGVEEVDILVSSFKDHMIIPDTTLFHPYSGDSIPMSASSQGANVTTTGGGGLVVEAAQDIMSSSMATTTVGGGLVVEAAQDIMSSSKATTTGGGSLVVEPTQVSLSKATTTGGEGGLVMEATQVSSSKTTTTGGEGDLVVEKASSMCALRRSLPGSAGVSLTLPSLPVAYIRVELVKVRINEFHIEVSLMLAEAAIYIVTEVKLLTKALTLESAL